MWRYYTLRLAYIFLGRLPLPVLYGIARIFADAAHRFRADARDAVRANMRRVMGPGADEREVRRAAREAFRNASRYYADLLRVGHINIHTYFRDRIEITGVEYLEAARSSRRGAIVVGAHFGNPEMSVQGLAALGYAFFGFTEPLEPPALSDLTHRLRSHHGHVYRTVGYRAVRESMRRVKKGGLIAVLLDRDVTGSGLPMQFFGAEASIPIGGIEIALRTGADVIVAKSWRLPGYRFRVEVCPPLKIEHTGDMKGDACAYAEQVLRILEDQIRSDPGQWAVLESIWPQADAQQPAS